MIAMAEAGLRGPVHLEAFGREEGEEARALASGVAERVAALAAAADPRNRVGLSPHAPYTVGPGLWAALAEVPYLAGRPWATHLAESDDETRVIAGGDGALTRGLRRHRGGARAVARRGGGGSGGASRRQRTP